MPELNRIDKAKLKFLARQIKTAKSQFDRRLSTIEANRKKATDDLDATLGTQIVAMEQEVATIIAKGVPTMEILMDEARAGVDSVVTQ